MRVVPTLRSAFAAVVSGKLLTGCAPAVGTPEWCEAFTEKPKQEWTADEVQAYLKTCVLGDTSIAEP